MKILFVTSVVPYPPIRGDKLRIFNIIKNINLHNDVKVISIVKSKREAQYAEEFRKLGYDLSTISLRRIKGFINLLRSLWTLEPFQVSFHFSKNLHELLRKETTSKYYDIIYFHLFTVAQYYKSINSKKSLKILDITDATPLYLKRFIEFIKNPFRKLFFKIELKLINKYEKTFSLFDVNYVCSKIDLEYYISKKIIGHFKLFTNGFDSQYFINESVAFDRYRILFVGNLPYFPNKDAVLFFAKEIFPLIQERYPSSTFYIVGSNPPDEIKTLESKYIKVTGYVDDIKHEYLISEVNVAPIRFGAGIQNKIIEALALGVPTVSSKMSVESFDDEIKKFIFTAETPDEYVSAICKIFSDMSIRNIKMRECSELIKLKMTWERIVKEEDAYLKGLINLSNT